MNRLGSMAFAQAVPSNSYKAIIVVSMMGGNDGNNMIIPLDSTEYSEYQSLRKSVSIPQSQCNVLSGTTGGKTYGFHPSLSNVSALYNQGKALAVANVGPLRVPVTKAALLRDIDLAPEALMSHPAGRLEWESSSTQALPTTGWGGRIGDLISQQSGLLPPVFNAGSPASIFTAGRVVQGIVLQSQTTLLTPLPNGINDAIIAIANDDSNSQNKLISQAAQLRAAAMAQQSLLIQAQSAGSSLQTNFPTTNFGQQIKTIAKVINGRSVVGASRQIFYCQQGDYDNHQGQLPAHANSLSEFDAGIGALTSALNEMGLADQVLICTHSDFNRTMAANGSTGTDHAWGNHQLIIGGGIRGGRIIGTLPELQIGGPTDLYATGIWVPTLSATQMTAGIGSWIGLTSGQLTSTFPDLANFPTGAIALN
jgi:uncharacterized protein (DUF1501 family)